MLVTPLLIRLLLFALPFVLVGLWYRKQRAAQKNAAEGEGAAPPDVAEPINWLLIGGVLALLSALMLLGVYELSKPADEDYRRSYRDQGLTDEDGNPQ